MKNMNELFDNMDVERLSKRHGVPVNILASHMIILGITALTKIEGTKTVSDGLIDVAGRIESGDYRSPSDTWGNA